MRLLWRRATDATAQPYLMDGMSSRPASTENAVDLPNDYRRLVDEMIRSHRSSLLLRPRLAQDLEPTALRAAIDRFRSDACLVSAGRVRLNRWQVRAAANFELIDSTDCVEVDAVFLERLTITNRQFQAFVDQGGYQKKSLWRAAVWSSVREFVDRTGTLGPRFWSAGRHDTSEANHPVVGVSWFEAEAYSRWIGMRLPTDAEWVRTACSPIETDNAITQRKYTWGDTFLSQRANLWNSGIGRTIPADANAEGDSVDGARQMIGNVWEWTSSNLQLWNGRAPIELAEPMKSLRGGAFDSYLDTRATCQCRSADNPLARRHNIGFRCAVSACDIIDTSDRVDELPAMQGTSEGTR
ncbi:MAG TPA: SUMF1/EgtB/PvdO family nonheme iron enzyme [Pirellulaceae bacterium]|nr:SUMF1/EgtB/PvdO family nonheme iron enzyme [Pirellulaceae bacterium]